jgi:hypothetical protein
MRSSFAWLLIAAVPACFEGDVGLFGCPPDEVCSDQTPDGLFFFGANLSGAFDLGNSATAVGGVQHVELQEQIGQTFFPLAAGYTAIGGAAVAVESKAGHVITLRGHATGSNKVEIRDSSGSLMDRSSFSANELATITVVGDKIGGSELPLAFLAGTVRAGIALRSADTGGGGVRLVDEAMTIEAANGTQVKWDLIEILDAQPGTIPATVTAAGKPAATVDLVVVAQVDELVDQLLLLGEAETLVAGEGAFVCFDAVAGGTHHVVNLDWTITGEGDGEVGTDLFGSDECAAITPQNAGEITITATAAGLTKVVTYPIAEAPSKPRAPATQPSHLRAGEVAALRATAAASRSR